MNDRRAEKAWPGEVRRLRVRSGSVPLFRQRSRDFLTQYAGPRVGRDKPGCLAGIFLGQSGHMGELEILKGT